MKIQFYALYNGRTGYLRSRSNISWTIISNPLEATIFADYKEAASYIEDKLIESWKVAFIRGTFCIANVIEEL